MKTLIKKIELSKKEIEELKGVFGFAHDTHNPLDGVVIETQTGVLGVKG